MNTFESCCKYLGISTELPKCQIDQKKLQAVYKLRVCMKAWNNHDGFEPDETANYKQGGDGHTPYFYLKNGRLLSSGNASYGTFAGIVNGYAYYADDSTYASFGLRLCFFSRKRAINFGETFIEIFNELI